INRYKYGLRIGLKDVKDSLIVGDVRFMGRHTVNRSVILVEGGGRAEVGEDFNCDHSFIVVKAPKGTTVKLASKLILSHAELPSVGPKTLATARECYIYRYFGGEQIEDPPEEFHARTVATTFFRRQNGDTKVYAPYHALAGADEME